MSLPRETKVGGQGIDTAALRIQIGQRVRQYEQRIADLTRALEASRKENRENVREESELERMQVRARLLEVRCQDNEARWQASLGQRRELQRALTDLEREHAKSSERIARLEEALRRERGEADAARAEVECLDEQVRQLRSLVEPLLAAVGIDAADV